LRSVVCTGMAFATALRMARTDTLSTQLDRLADADTGPYPVVSLYLNLQPGQTGRDNFEPFLRNEFGNRLRTYPAGGPERQSLEQDEAKIRDYVAGVPAMLNGVAVFACSAADLFETIELAAPVDEHRLYISDEPHLYPLARLIDEYPRFAVLLADTQSARIFVIAANQLQQTEEVQGIKTRRHKAGGWSQTRFQRHIDNYREQHAKEVVETLGRIAATESIDSIVIAGDEVIVPLLKAQLSKELAQKIVDVVKLDIRAPLKAILEAGMASMRAKDVETDRERVDALVSAYRAGGLAVVGGDSVRTALELGQVEELLITADPAIIDPAGASIPHPSNAERTPEEVVADQLIVKARSTAARVRFIEDPALLLPYGGVGAFLRFKL
jgi:peptide chain release factor subunit 1